LRNQKKSLAAELGKSKGGSSNKLLPAIKPIVTKFLLLGFFQGETSSHQKFINIERREAFID
jgi:hypothetical protein